MDGVKSVEKVFILSATFAAVEMEQNKVQPTDSLDESDSEY